MKIDFKNNWHLLAVLILSLITFILFISRVIQNFNFTVDDSFITFRYVNHLANGFGLVWNIGDVKPTEGFTSLLWILVLFPAEFLRIDIVLYSKIISVIFTFILILVLLYFIDAQIQIKKEHKEFRVITVFISAIVISIFLSSVDLVAHIVSGMETILITLLVTLLTILFINYYQKPGKLKALIIAFVSILVGLTRPEFNLFSLSGIVGLIFISKYKRDLVKYCLGVYLLIGTTYYICRFYYFGLPFPLPFYVKQFKPDQIFPGLLPTLQFGLKYSIFFLIVFYSLLGLGGLRNVKPLVPVLTAIILLLMYSLSVQHIMSYNNRYLFPLFPPIILVFIYLISLKSYIILSKGFRVLILMCLVLGFSFSQVYYYGNVRKALATYTIGMQQAHVKLGRLLNELNFIGNYSIALGDAGAIPYYSKWYTIDTFGLNNRIIALNIQKGIYNVNDIFSILPDLIVVLSSSGKEFKPLLKNEILIYDDLKNFGYKKIGDMEFSTQYYLWIYSNNETIKKFILNNLSSDSKFRRY